MISKTITKSIIKAAVIAATGCATLALAGPAAADAQEFTTFHVVQLCTGGGQVCSGVEEAGIITSGESVNIEFTADAGHCSDIQVTLGVDDEPLGDVVLSPGERSGAFITPLKPGVHVVFAKAVGLEGGCNVGKLGSWEGDLLIQRLA